MMYAVGGTATRGSGRLDVYGCRLKSLPITRQLLIGFIAVLCSLMMQFASAQDSLRAERGQWMAAMGESGLRRFYSSGSDLGEVANRVVSYQTANRVYQQTAGQPDGPQPRDMRSRSDTWVVQNDTLFPLHTSLRRPVFGRALVRIADRDEPHRLESRNDRLDLSLLYAPDAGSFISVGLAGELTRADIHYVDGTTEGKAWGPRFDFGRVLGPVWAIGVRADYMRFSGDNEVRIGTPAGLLNIYRDVEYQRRYLQIDLMGRYNRSRINWLPPRAMLRWTQSLQHLHTRHRDKRNSLGQPVNEPFGPRERYTLVRTGLNLSNPLTDDGRWSAFGELTLDYELETNMTFPLSDRTVVSASAGVVRQFAPGKRVQLVYDRYQHTRDRRSRNNLSIISVMDFF